MPPPIAKLAPGLQRAWEATQGFYADALPQLRKVGETFLGLAERPEYFATGKELPKGYNDKEAAQFLAKKHGVHLRSLGNHGMVEGGATGGNPFSLIATEMRSPAGHTHALHTREGRLNPDTRMWEIDSMEAGAGTGVAKSVYPALYEFILSRADAANRTGGASLSPSNAWRRSGNMVGTLEKYGKPAADRLLIDDYQLAPLGARSREVPYHRLPLEAQVGLLNLLGAARTGSVVDRAAEVARNSRGALGSLVDKVGLGEPGKLWEPTTDISPVDLELLQHLVRGASQFEGTAQAVGKDSLRRAAIANDAFNRGLLPEDLIGQEFLTERLARRAGGSVPARRPGGLAQTCSCGER